MNADTLFYVSEFLVCNTYLQVRIKIWKDNSKFRMLFLTCRQIK